MNRARQAPTGIDPSKPAPARIHDYLLSGENNFQSDRDAADRITAVVPEIRDSPQNASCTTSSATGRSPSMTTARPDQPYRVSLVDARNGVPGVRPPVQHAERPHVARGIGVHV